MPIGVLLSVVLVSCSSNANTTAETIPLVTTTMVSICDPPEHLDCAGANLIDANLAGPNLEGADFTGANLYKANLSGANLRGANLTVVYLIGATMPDGSNHD